MKAVTFIGWDDSPHLTPDLKAEFIKGIPPHQILSRTRGIPYLGAGAIYPIPLEEILVDGFVIPNHWPRAFALDVGWNRTAALWGALDRGGDVLYLYSEHYVGKEEPQIHAAAILGNGGTGDLRAKWIPGVIDPNARGRQQKDGIRLVQAYRDLGLDLDLALNAVEAGIHEVWQRLSSGRLKVFRHLTAFTNEYCLYRRKEDGQILKKNDHLMDCFSGETLVVTDKGSVPIAELAGTEGRVLGPSGWNEYTDCRLYRKQSRVVTVEFADGRAVTCTPDHLFMTRRGWIKAESLENMDCHNVVLQAVCKSQSDSLLRRARNSWDAAITFAESIFNETARGFTGQYGKPLMVDPYLAGLPSTIGTTTERTISRTISNLLSEASTHPIIRRGIDGHSLQRLSQWLAIGMDHLLVKNGTNGTTLSTYGRLIRETLIGHANSADQSLRRRDPRETGFDSVRLPAERRTGFFQGSTLSSVSAPDAESHFPSHQNINRSDIAPALARSYPGVVRVKDAGCADTYCLTASPDSAFTVEGGIIVHNCLKYLVMSGISRMKAVPTNRNLSHQRVDGGASQSANGWMSG